MVDSSGPISGVDHPCGGIAADAGFVLVVLAYLILPTARSGRLCNCAAVPTWSTLGLFQSFADMLKFLLEGADDPGERQQGRCSCWRR